MIEIASFILIVILSIFVLILMGFFIYDAYLDIKEQKPNLKERGIGMKTYISKPIEVKAELFNPDRIEEYKKLGAEFSKNTHGSILLKTLEDYTIIGEGDYLVIGTKGEFYPCKKDIFENKYVKSDF